MEWINRHRWWSARHLADASASLSFFHDLHSKMKSLNLHLHPPHLKIRSPLPHQNHSHLLTCCPCHSRFTSHHLKLCPHCPCILASHRQEWPFPSCKIYYLYFQWPPKYCWLFRVSSSSNHLLQAKPNQLKTKQPRFPRKEEIFWKMPHILLYKIHHCLSTQRLVHKARWKACSFQSWSLYSCQQPASFWWRYSQIYPSTSSEPPNADI